MKTEFENTISALKNALAHPLPGKIAHALVEPEYRKGLYFPDDEQEGLQSAVLLLLYPDENGYTHVPLILRSASLRVHSNQIGLPGGKFEESDKDLFHTALRESQEELGILPSEVSFLGKLTPVYIPPTRFWIHPFIGTIPYRPALTIETGEVQELFEPKVKELLRNSNLMTFPYCFENTVYRISGYKIAGHCIWGATGMIFSELKFLLNIK